MEKVYVLESGGLHKIGFTTGTVKDRVKSMTTGNPFTINIIREYDSKDGKKEEKKLHKKFYKKRIQGEWFRLTKKDIDKIDKMFNVFFDKKYSVFFENTKVQGSNFFKQCIDSGIDSFNICIGYNIFPLSYLGKITDFRYSDIKIKLYNDTHKGLLEIINRDCIHSLFYIGSKRALLHSKEIDEIIDSGVFKVDFLRNGIIIVLGNKYKIAVTINVNPKYT